MELLVARALRFNERVPPINPIYYCEYFSTN